MDADARAVRDLVYMTLAQEGRTPSVAELARRTGSTAGAVQSTLRSLADAHALVLTSDQDAVRMAHPFSAAPMAFVVTPTDGLDDRRWWGGCALFPPVGCDRRSPLRMASYASPRRVPLCGSGRGPVSVHPHAARFPRPTDSAGRADIVGDRRAAGLPGRRCCIQPRRPVTFSESTTTADGGRLSLPKTPTGSALVSLRGRIPSTRRDRGQDPPRTRDHRAGPRRPQELGPGPSAVKIVPGECRVAGARRHRVQPDPGGGNPVRATTGEGDHRHDPAHPDRCPRQDRLLSTNDDPAPTDRMALANQLDRTVHPHLRTTDNRHLTEMTTAHTRTTEMPADRRNSPARTIIKLNSRSTSQIHDQLLDRSVGPG